VVAAAADVVAIAVAVAADAGKFFLNFRNEKGRGSSDLAPFFYSL
jgi:hypothetical protein